MKTIPGWSPPVLLLTAALAYCTDLPTEQISGPTIAAESSSSPHNVVGPETLAKFWDDGQAINVAVSAGSEQALLEGAASTAASNWNSRVLNNFQQLPKFAQVGGATLPTPRIVLNFDDSDYSGSGPFGYCGSVGAGTGTGQDQEREITISKKDDTDLCGGRIVDDLTGVIAHEFSQALGVGGPPSSETVWCVANVQDTGETLNKQPCAWEEQLIYHGYEILPDTIAPPQFDSLIARSVWIQAPAMVDTVVAGDTVEFRAKAFAGPEPSQPFPRDSTRVFRGASWSVSNASSLDILSQTDTSVTVTAGASTGESYLIIDLDPDRNTLFPWPRDLILIRNPSPINSDFCLDWTSMWRNTDQYLNAGCGQKGPNIRYRWQFDAGGPWTTLTADTLFDFPGHAGSGTKTVTLETRDISTGDTALAVRQFSVAGSDLPLFGPAAITEKKVYSYSSSGAPCWFVRPLPGYIWNALGNCQTSINYIWPAGEYSAIMRAEDAPAHARARKAIQVCTVTQSCAGSMEFRLAGESDDLAQGTQGGRWGLFGIGPWMSAAATAEQELLRLYDLTGQWEAGNRFAELSWLAGEGGTEARLGWTVTWQVEEEAWPDAKVVRFATTAPGGTAHRFGLAIDPDLGVSAADDRSGYDGSRNLVYAYDDKGAVGFLILDGAKNASVYAEQYGSRRLAPRVVGEARTVHDRTGVQLASGRDDVQLLVWKPARRGTADWTVIILRGDSRNAIGTLADEILAVLR